MRSRREKKTFMASQLDFIDYFLKKVEEEKAKPSTLYTGNLDHVILLKPNTVQLLGSIKLWCRIFFIILICLQMTNS